MPIGPKKEFLEEGATLVCRASHDVRVIVPLGIGMTGREIAQLLEPLGFTAQQLNHRGIFRLSGGDIDVEVPAERGDHTLTVIDPQELYRNVTLIWKTTLEYHSHDYAPEGGIPTEIPFFPGVVYAAYSELARSRVDA